MSRPTVEHRIPVRIVPLEVREAREMPDLPEDVASAFVFSAEASNNSLDFYYTHMLESTLRNFARDGSGGVQFLDSHNNRNLGYGRTFAGRVETLADRKPDFSLDRAVELAIDPPAEYMRTLLDVFTVPGIRFGGGLTYSSTDDFIVAARTGLARDVSVGFYGGSWTCDICGGNYRSYDSCPHFAGAEYALGEQGERQVIATVSIDGAHLAELSAVYDGATPEAMIVKAERMARIGELEPETKQLLEARYKLSLPERSTIHIGADFDMSNTLWATEKRGILKKENRMDFEDLYNEARTVATEAMGEELEPAQAIRQLAEEVERLRPLADDGRTYRSDLIEEALAEGVRANGDEFAEETYRGILERADIATIKRMRDDWKRLGDKRFPGGSGTVPEDETPASEQTREPNLVPDEAYRA